MIMSVQTIQEMIEYANARSAIYKLLSTTFTKELSKESLEIFRGNKLAETLRDLGIDFGNNFYTCDAEELVKKLSEEYAALFILPGGINPTESVARSGLYMQAFAGQTLKFYKQCGFILSDDFKGFPDHIGIELEFMSHLSKNEAITYKNGAEDEAKKWSAHQKMFLEEHLSHWAMDLAKNVAAYTQQSFYREIAHFLYEFIGEETKEFARGAGYSDGQTA
ncbi:MAG: hypothetical protein A3G39_05510 [Deltaproteobacteria bacterium RIFCSPLOWO2_12_FULL_43_16]|nr:MAG: hypothetical protein A2Z89_02220 [Deltaproteobacteria bacterium GWA2_43_19]OGQ60870.1 MAG: hypothetical protein A3G39_05510 [Deltaproteobacteria bacterium RIFCSPLOWO2_12_FULL_43_16]HBR17477.1 hypothetical protein [Deltaproteobacteria bacterium]